MFCRFCGSQIPDDSVFCARCGKRLSEKTSGPKHLPRRLRLNTPYPWAAILFVVFVSWTLWPDAQRVDFATLAFELEIQAESSLPDQQLFTRYLSLVVENGGPEPVRNVAVELHADLSPDQPGEAVAEFRGGRYTVLRDGEALPLVLVLSDEIEAGEKRRFPIDSTITTTPPAVVTFSIVEERSGRLLASLSAPLGDTPPSESPEDEARARVGPPGTRFR